jgi:hypothetical protein
MRIHGGECELELNLDQSSFVKSPQKIRGVGSNQNPIYRLGEKFSAIIDGLQWDQRKNETPILLWMELHVPL